jgi:esterase/lipase superfamily enzyme
VVVHGYNVSFEDAVRRAAQLADDLDFPGVPVLYSWPSEGRAHGYTADEMNVEWTLPHFEELLGLVLAGGAGGVHLFAEGMGNRVLVRALGALGEHQGQEARLGQVLFAVPDVDRDTFLGLVPRFRGRAERFTLYGSARDPGLRAARIVHGRPRAGEAGDATVLADGIDFIDATGAAVVGDAALLLRDGLPPDRRPGLTPRERPDGRSWALQP